MLSTEKLESISSQVRRDVIRMVSNVNSGHPGGALGCADFLTALYFGIMKHQPDNFTINGENQDLFFLSNGHLSAAWYSVLAHAGYFDYKDLSTFRKINSHLQGHPTTHDALPGIRVASGSLGQGLSVSIGAALSKKLNNDDAIIYSLLGDGELEEGQVWEAALYAAHNKVDNIIATVDYNGRQIDGDVDDVMSLGNLKAKWEAFGWIVLEMNGNDFKDILKTINIAKEKLHHKKPIIILMKTEMGFGVDFMMGSNAWHGKAPNQEQTKLALSQLEETLGDF